jgi:serine protease SohB
LDYLLQYGLFLAKSVTFVITIVAILIAIIALTSKQKHKKGELELTDLSEQIKKID